MDGQQQTVATEASVQNLQPLNSEVSAAVLANTHQKNPKVPSAAEEEVVFLQSHAHARTHALALDLTDFEV